MADTNAIVRIAAGARHVVGPAQRVRTWSRLSLLTPTGQRTLRQQRTYAARPMPSVFIKDKAKSPVGIWNGGQKREQLIKTHYELSKVVARFPMSPEARSTTIDNAMAFLATDGRISTSKVARDAGNILVNERAAGVEFWHVHQLTNFIPGFQSHERSIHVLLSSAGYAPATARVVRKAMMARRLGSQGVLKGSALVAVRQDLRRLCEERIKENTWARAYEAKLLAMEGKIDEAIALCKTTIPEVLEQTNDSTPYFDNQGRADAPWHDLIEWYQIKQSKSSGPEYDHLAKEISAMVDLGVSRNDAICHFHAAQRAQKQYRWREHQGYFDHEANASREPRNYADIGKSSLWLYHMNQSAMHLYPEACVELAKFYWKTEWRYLDDEPPSDVKPTPLDRYPVQPTSTVQRILEAVGFKPNAPKMDDIFKTVCWPISLKKRIQLAEDWLLMALRVYYIPALRELIEIYSTQYVSEYIAPDMKAVRLHPARHEYDDKIKLINAVFDGKYDQRREPSKVSNPLKNDEAAKDRIAQAFQALELREFHKKSDGGVTREDIQHMNSVDEASRLRSFQPSARDVTRSWYKQRDIFELWRDDDAFCQELDEYIRTLCAERKWTIRDHEGNIWYRPKASG